ncbi:magnesium chelatase ATPase subunit D [Rhodospirillum rubrum]|uniref:magnesium chelatase subunit D n=1 Tax=Rhodospirillum rubrum TaxID=1085 RepID=UPI001906E3AB|nr:magnesium chelatase subunit D [Rhodospirillum rubrum]MBK1663358.1 magnesium chelatase ATPase subunit D [Rhodospirillum rubrum]MBK1676889.1 magnesium chelatase ATPase subunit D [Rhodospirillum rubrum]
MTAPAAFNPLTWDEAARAAAMVAVDPVGLGGAVIRALPGPPRDRWLAYLRELLPADAPLRRMPLHISDDRLLGGLDLAATLRAGRPVAQRGLLAEAHNGIVVLAMAERAPVGTVAQLCSVIDCGEVRTERDGLGLRSPAHLGVVALDEGLEEDEHPLASLVDRLAISLDLGPLRDLSDDGELPDADMVQAARENLGAVTIPETLIETLCATAAAFGILSLRVPLFALRVARTAAALDGRTAVEDADIMTAVRLVLAPRALVLPMPPEDDTEDQPPPPPPPEEPPESEPEQKKDQDDQGGPTLEEMAVAAAAALMPAGMLARLRAAGGLRRKVTPPGKAGALKAAKTRGRPAGTRPGAPGPGARLSVIDTLRAAAPWQRVRRDEEAARLGDEGVPAAEGGPAGPRVLVRPDDFRVTRLRQRAQTTTIFVVDASGSSALHRLAEAKGAVELLLADCYVRRDQVALVAFRGARADVLLPPTRSLVRAKRSLQRLPGGGGTPLASGLDVATALAELCQRRGETPVLVVLTDGRANVGRDGTGGRAKAESDAQSAARALRAMGLGVLLVDTAPRPDPRARKLAEELDACYLALPHADAMAISQGVRAAMT